VRTHSSSQPRSDFTRQTTAAENIEDVAVDAQQSLGQAAQVGEVADQHQGFGEDLDVHFGDGRVVHGVEAPASRTP